MAPPTAAVFNPVEIPVPTKKSLQQNSLSKLTPPKSSPIRDVDGGNVAKEHSEETTEKTQLKDISRLTSALEITTLYRDLISTEFKKQDSIPGHYLYENLRPSFPDIKEPPLGHIDVIDAGVNADPKFTNLLQAVDRLEHLAPKIGTVLHGLELAKLDNHQKDELARLIAVRGVVVVRGQQEFDIQQQLALGRHWGPLHRHATTAVPKGHTEDPSLLDVHVVYGDESRVPGTGFSQEHLWHADVSYEKQPPSYTSLKLLQGPPTGGDTSWTSGYGIYDSLSPALQEYLEKHVAIHSAHEQANDAIRAGKPVRRDAVVSKHPLVRVNPVTGHKSLFVNSGFIRAIEGVPTVESDAILNLLNKIISTDVSNTIRWKWEEGDIVFWDNRTTIHSASWGFYPHRRHAVRVTVVGEEPYFDSNGTSEQETIDEALGIRSLDKDGSKQGNYND